MSLQVGCNENWELMIIHGVLSRYANLRGAKLSGANLSWSLLERADLSHCQVTAIDYMTKCPSFASITYIYVSCQLEGAQMLGVKMVCANLEGANLKGANFEVMNFHCAYLCILKMAKFEEILFHITPCVIMIL